MRLTPLLLLITVATLATSTLAWRNVQRSGTIKVSVHQGSSAWWLALAVSDSSTTAVAIKDNGLYANSWQSLTSETWGYWTFQPTAGAITPPISVKLTSGSSTLEISGLIPSIVAGSAYDTGATYSGSASPSSPATSAPATSKPSTPATSAPATSKPSAPATSAPATSAPATAAPTNAPTSPSGAIKVQLNSASGAYWIAVAITGGSSSATAVSLKDSGSYSSYQTMETTNWGFFVFQPTSQLTLPISLRVTSSAGSVDLNSVITSFSNFDAINTGKNYGDSSSSSPATAAPTQKPGSGATSAPTKPTSAPATSAPATSKPATSAPATSAPATPKPATSAPATSAPATSAPSTSAPATGNPFTNTQFYINPHYTGEVDSSIVDYPSMSTKMTKVKGYASAYWLDRIAAIQNLTTIMNQAKDQQASAGKTVLVALVVYDLPNRDCAAAASNGELQCGSDPTCASALNTYKTQYIDAIYNILKQYPNQRIVAFIEPDSLPNLATNIAVAKCAASQTAYVQGVAYAINKLSGLSNVYMYVDAAHGGWLGWDAGRAAAITVFAEVLSLAGGASKIRGFATNVANYQPLGSMSDSSDPCGLSTQWNFATNEVKYVGLLQTSLTAAGITGMHFVIDTGRNGNTAARSDCTQWCNILNAGLGQPPTTSTSSSGRSDIDAFFWVKPPGESDGTSNTQATRYDYHCGSSESAKPAPEAGVWFSSYFAGLINNANPSV